MLREDWLMSANAFHSSSPVLLVCLFVCFFHWSRIYDFLHSTTQRLNSQCFNQCFKPCVCWNFKSDIFSSGGTFNVLFLFNQSLPCNIHPKLSVAFLSSSVLSIILVINPVEWYQLFSLHIWFSPGILHSSLAMILHSYFLVGS